MREATKWLTELSRESITSLEELTEGIYEKIFPPSKMVKLRDDIQNFKRIDVEPIHETWLGFKILLLQCPTNGFSDIVYTMEKNKEHDENMAKIMNQMDL
ncbi:hypothetical protein MTR67_002677 [Solanum verrucosum]|uniref:Retrotransposon gag domain-containing protein n=1 Tax=Solanum verrucosum TaxID=315347 RepID=A0AAF0T652_SOLVR|nr:hypothetical protein MTR67_002677 [Solanum verrucosum]